MNSFFLQKGNVYALPILHASMEIAALTCRLFQDLKPDCVAVELPDTMNLQLLHAASRLPDISIVRTASKENEPLLYLIEPCEPAFEALRSALENQIPAFCIDLDLDDYPKILEHIPDPYSIQKIGLKTYYEIYLRENASKRVLQDASRELHMAKKLKELSLRYEKVLFIGGMAHIDRILNALDLSSFPIQESPKRNIIELITPTEDSTRHILGEWGWLSFHYEQTRESFLNGESALFPPDRQKLIYNLYKAASDTYKIQGYDFPGYNLRNVMKFVRNLSLLKGRLMPDLFEILEAAKGCVDHNFAYETWVLATEYPYRKNLDNLPEEPFDPKDIWGHSRYIRFHLKQKSKKSFFSYEKRKNTKQQHRYPPGPFSICSYPPEDILVENFGHFLKRKGTQIIKEQGARTLPFSTSIEDGIDVRETIRHFTEKKLYVKTSGKPQGKAGSVVMIFDEDTAEKLQTKEKYPWKLSWLGEHTQESDMAFYATKPQSNVVGPGISKCLYGGFMMSYPPRRLMDVWFDPDYIECRSKAEVLLMAAIDYSIEPLIIYVAESPPRSFMKAYAKRFGKKVVYIPIGQLSPLKIKKLCTFHVLDGQEKREIAGDYIF